PFWLKPALVPGWAGTRRASPSRRRERLCPAPRVAAPAMAASGGGTKGMDLRSDGAGLVIAMAVQGAAQGAAAGGASRQAIAAAVAAALRTAWALLADGGSEEDAELAMRWQAMEPAMRQQLRGVQACGAARARRNVGAHVVLGKGVEALREALVRPQRAQRGGRCGPRVPAQPDLAEAGGGGSTPPSPPMVPSAAVATEVGGNPFDDHADDTMLEGSVGDGAELDVDVCKGTDQVVDSSEARVDASEQEHQSPFEEDTVLGEVPPFPQLSAAVGEEAVGGPLESIVGAELQGQESEEATNDDDFVLPSILAKMEESMEAQRRSQASLVEDLAKLRALRAQELSVALRNGVAGAVDEAKVRLRAAVDRLRLAEAAFDNKMATFQRQCEVLQRASQRR
ncbi:unnamed protein product, partial [Prorocentrum cordatum]